MCVPETKGVPLEEMAALFGDKDEVVIFSGDIPLSGQQSTRLKTSSAEQLSDK
jgi:precorrin-6B methylase 1